MCGIASHFLLDHKLLVSETTIVPTVTACHNRSVTADSHVELQASKTWVRDERDPKCHPKQNKQPLTHKLTVKPWFSKATASIQLPRSATTLDTYFKGADDTSAHAALGQSWEDSSWESRSTFCCVVGQKCMDGIVTIQSSG